MDIIGKLVKHIAATKYENIPPETVDLTKKGVFDTIGVLLAGTLSPEGQIVTDLIKEWNGKAESSVINYGFKAPAHHAAFVNSTIARVVDLDDVFDRGSMHVHCSIVPSAFAIAEKMGNVNGRDLLTAIILGTDLLCRMGLSNKVPTAVSGMNSSYQYGAFGVTATAGKLLSLSEDQLWNAMGIAYSLTSGNSQCLVEGAMTTRLGQGSCAHAGILSAFLAQKGFTGVKNVLQGKFGYYTCYHRGQYDPEVLTDGLGKSFEALDITFKRYPCCAHTHAPIEGTLKLMEKHHLKPEDIKEIHVGVNQQAFNIVADPLVVKRDPQDIAVAQFSIPYTQGTVVLKKKIFIDDFTPQAIRNPEVLKFAKKVNVYVDPEIQKKYPGVRSPAKVKLITQTGEALQENVDFIKGDPKSPLSMNELIDKFKACNSFARHPISDQSIKEVLEIVGNLEKLSDVNRLIQLLG